MFLDPRKVLETIHHENINRMIFAQLNINLLRNKFDSLQTVISDDREVAETCENLHIVPSLKVLPKENYEMRIGNDNQPVLNNINLEYKFRNHPSIKLIKSKKKRKNKLLSSIMFLMKKLRTYKPHK